MRIATWNINGVLRRLDLLLDWLTETRPDVVCLQELKVSAADFPRDALDAAGYGAVWQAEGRWNGVAILVRGQTPHLIKASLPGEPSDFQARYIEAAVGGRIIASIYVPNGNPQPGPKFDYKLAWMARLKTHIADLLEMGGPLVLAGDFNVAPTAQDIYETQSYDDSALIHPDCRAAHEALLGLGLTDTHAHLRPSNPGYTFWDYRRKRWERDAGLRLDHIFVNPLAALALTATDVDRSMRGRENASDHAPYWVELD